MSCKENEVNHISAGPWGGQYGTRWDDGAYSTIRQVVIASSAVIHSIQFEYDSKGRAVWSEKHGGSGGIKLDKIRLDCPNEYLVSINGYCGSISEDGPVIVRSLTFQSNRKKYGPFGIQVGTSFSLPISGGKLVGFHGRSSWHLDSIGVHVKPVSQRTPPSIVPAASVNYPSPEEALNRRQVVSYGPWGGSGGIKFDDGIYTGVREIHLTRSGGLVSIRVCYDLNGRAVWGAKNGGSGGLKLDKIVFDYPFEVLTHITGYYESTILRGPTIIKSITFHTTKRSYGPFGDQQGISFSLGTKEGVIVGFHGRKGYFIDSIGVHVLQGKPQLSPLPPKPSNTSDLQTHQLIPGARKTDPQLFPLPRKPSNMIDLQTYQVTPVARKSDPCGPGPSGGNGGKSWDDGAYTGVRKILLTRGEAICSIQIEYDRNGQSVWSAQHGHGNNACTYIIEIDYPDEVLSCVSGYYDFISGRGGFVKVIRSLTFYTNVAEYGPFGEEIGTWFSSGNTEGKVVGFHGRSGVYLDAIGVHMQHRVENENSYKWVVEQQSIKAVLSKILMNDAYS